MHDFSQLVCPTCLGDLTPAADALNCAQCGGQFPCDGTVVDLIDPRTLLRVPEADLAAWHITQDRAAPLYEVNDIASCSDPDRSIVIAFKAFVESEGLAVLDIGSGVQTLPGYVEGRAMRSFVGLDPLRPKSPPPFRVIRALGERVPFRSATFDAVILATSLDHALDVGATLSEVERVLKPTGSAYFWGMWVPQPEMHGRVFETNFIGRQPQAPESGLSIASASAELAERSAGWVGDRVDFDFALVDRFHVRHFQRMDIFEHASQNGLLVTDEVVVSENGAEHTFLRLQKVHQDANISSQLLRLRRNQTSVQPTVDAIRTDTLAATETLQALTQSLTHSLTHLQATSDVHQVAIQDLHRMVAEIHEVIATRRRPLARLRTLVRGILRR